MKVSAPNGIGFGTSKTTPSAETAETLLRGGFGIGFGTNLGTFIGNRFRHQTAWVLALVQGERDELPWTTRPATSHVLLWRRVSREAKLGGRNRPGLNQARVTSHASSPTPES